MMNVTTPNSVTTNSLMYIAARQLQAEDENSVPLYPDRRKRLPTTSLESLSLSARRTWISAGVIGGSSESDKDILPVTDSVTGIAEPMAN